MLWYSIALFSAVLSAAAAVAQKKILFDMDALGFSFVLSVLNALLALPLLFFIDMSSVAFPALLILYIKTIFGALAFLCVMLAIKNMEISGALPLLVLTPGIVALFAYLLLEESLTGIEILGIFLLLAGTYILETKESSGIFGPIKIFWQSKYHHYVIYALLLFSVSSIADKFLLTSYKLPPYEFLVFQQFFLFINFIFMTLLAKRNMIDIFKSVPKFEWTWILLVAALTIGYRYTQILAFQMAPVALVLSLKRTSVFFATIAGGRIFKEHNLLKKIIATAIMVAGAIMIAENV